MFYPRCGMSLLEVLPRKEAINRVWEGAGTTRGLPPRRLISGVDWRAPSRTHSGCFPGSPRNANKAELDTPGCVYAEDAVLRRITSGFTFPMPRGEQRGCQSIVRLMGLAWGALRIQLPSHDTRL